MSLEALVSNVFPNFMHNNNNNNCAYGSSSSSEANTLKNINMTPAPPSGTGITSSLPTDNPSSSMSTGSFVSKTSTDGETAKPVGRGRKRGRRSRTCKSKEKAETQRMTHIAIERNRRKQMNEYLAVLRSLMPEFYIQRGDQASIVGGAIEFVKELEQLLQSLEVQKRIIQQQQAGMSHNNSNTHHNFFSPPFSQFFTCPQYSWCQISGSECECTGENQTAIADIEVTMSESHANLRILSRRRPKQLFKMVTGFHTLHLTILHLNVTTLDPLVLYSFSAKVEEGCKLTSVDEIAGAVHHMLKVIDDEEEEEAGIIA